MRRTEVVGMSFAPHLRLEGERNTTPLVVGVDRGKGSGGSWVAGEDLTARSLSRRISRDKKVCTHQGRPGPSNPVGVFTLIRLLFGILVDAPKGWELFTKVLRSLDGYEDGEQSPLSGRRILPSFH
jgi:hypothetical protein